MRRRPVTQPFVGVFSSCRTGQESLAAGRPLEVPSVQAQCRLWIGIIPFAEKPQKFSKHDFL
jgi:hypothetical protein